MEYLLEKVIKNAFKLQFIENKNKVMTSDCFEPNNEEDDYYNFADLIRCKKIPHNDVISFKPIMPRVGKYEITLNLLKKKDLQDFFEDKISLIDLLNGNKKGTYMQFNNTFNSYDNSTQNINISYDIKGDWNALAKVLKDLNVTTEQIEELKNAMLEDKKNAEGINNDTVLTKTRETAKKIASYVGLATANTSIVLVVQTIAKALSNYYGFPVQF